MPPLRRAGILWVLPRPKRCSTTTQAAESNSTGVPSRSSGKPVLYEAIWINSSVASGGQARSRFRRTMEKVSYSFFRAGKGIDPALLVEGLFYRRTNTKRRAC